MPSTFSRRRRLLVPEVVQTSAMDCGPASLKCLLEGFGISASYGRLREACQTEVDGSSIDTMEEVAVQLGLEAEQIMVPLDHLLIPGLEPLPAIIVVRRVHNATHFLVAWRRTGGFIQLMDPAVGRRWITTKKFLEEVYVHTMPIAAAAWREWAATPAFCDALNMRLAGLGMNAAGAKRIINDALTDEGWRPLAAVDAAARMMEEIVRAGGIRRGRQAARVVERFANLARDEATGDGTIPADFWSAHASKPSDDGEEQVLLRGAVLVHVRGLLAAAGQAAEATAAKEAKQEAQNDGAQLPPELVAALEEKPSRPGLDLLRILHADGALAPSILVIALVLAASGLVVEALLFRGLFDIGRELNLSGQRLGAIGALIAFGVALLVLELPIVTTVLRLGRRLETRMRMLFMDKIPRLGDRYFHSRLTSDMTERSHSLQRIRMLPALGERFTRLGAELILTTLGIIWLDPASAPLAILAALLVVAVPLAVQPVLVERNLRVRNHAGGLSRFYFDSLAGLFAVRAHGAERAVRRQHESLLIEWAQAGVGLQRAVVTAEGLQLFVGFGLSAMLLFNYFGRAGESSGLLLFIYWVLNLPMLGQEIGLVARQYPDYRNVTLRLLEPLGALEETDAQTEDPGARTEKTEAWREGTETLRATIGAPQAVTTSGMEAVAQPTANSAKEERPAVTAAPTHDNGAHAQVIRTRGLPVFFENVSVRAAGHTILEEVNLRIEAGEHVAIVGSSGAGKSSLVGILLGWHRAASGRVMVGGEPLTGRRLAELRREIAWVDPTVQLWNRSFIDNLRYGADPDASLAINRVIKLADLLDVLEKLPDGLQTSLGEGGALVSGGQGQRVRLGRAMLREGARLVILDEPFRGLERERRRALLARAREHWRETTLICITHDVAETRTFGRVVVIDKGCVVEDGCPEQLAAQPDSRYQALLAAEEEVRTGMWLSDEWRRLALREKHLIENDSAGFKLPG